MFETNDTLKKAYRIGEPFLFSLLIKVKQQNKEIC